MKKRMKWGLQFFAEDPEDKEPEKKKPEEKPDDQSAVERTIAQLKKRAEDAEKKAAELQKKNEEQEAALSGLLDGSSEGEKNDASAAFWGSLRYRKRKGG